MVVALLLLKPHTPHHKWKAPAHPQIHTLLSIISSVLSERGWREGGREREGGGGRDEGREREEGERGGRERKDGEEERERGREREKEGEEGREGGGGRERGRKHRDTTIFSYFLTGEPVAGEEEGRDVLLC